MRILAAIDGSPYSDAVLDEIRRRPWPAGSEVEVAVAINPVPLIGSELWAVPADYCTEIEEVARAGAEKVLEAARARLGACEGVAVTSQVLTGPPAHAVLDEAERWKADLVLVGSHGYGNVKRFVLGSVSQGVALNAPCSVEIVREKPGH